MFTVMAATIFTATRAPAPPDAFRPARASRRSFWSLRALIRRRLGGGHRG